MDMHVIRIDRLRQRIAKEKVDLLAFGPGVHMQWLLGFNPYPDELPCLFCLFQNGATFLMPALNAEGSRESTNLPFYEWSDAYGPKVALDHLIRDFDIPADGQIALYETMRADFAALIQDAMPYASLQFSTSTVGALRMHKDSSEYRLLKEQAGIADKVIQTVWS